MKEVVMDERRAFNHDPAEPLPPAWHPDRGDWLLCLLLIPVSLLMVMICWPMAMTVKLWQRWRTGAWNGH